MLAWNSSHRCTLVRRSRTILNHSLEDKNYWCINFVLTKLVNQPQSKCSTKSKCDYQLGNPRCTNNLAFSRIFNSNREWNSPKQLGTRRTPSKSSNRNRSRLSQNLSSISCRSRPLKSFAKRTSSTRRRNRHPFNVKCGDGSLPGWIHHVPIII